ncbi:MAG TPA: glycosyltransferase family 4 protein [Blastocatellia bacterium]|jgi:glycosyltransferase involved in cell wall biosynthesis
MAYQKKPIKVCLVVASLDILGGQSIQALRLLEGLLRAGEVYAEVLPINPRLPEPLRALQRIKYVRTVVTSILYVASLLIKLPRFDVVQVFSASNFSFLISPAPAVLIAKLFGKPVILNYHSGQAEDHLKNYPRTAIPIIKLADRLVVPSDFLVDVFAKFGIRAEAIFNTVDFARFRYRKRDSLRPILFANRNLESHYNVECALRAFALVQRQVPPARLIVAGDGSERAKLHAAAAELGLKNIEFVGAVPPEQMPALYDRADIYLNSSDVDNMPLSILEAFACGLPVVTTDAGGIPYIVTDLETGLLARRGDHRALAASILRLLADDALGSKLASRAHEECRKYEWSAVSGQWHKLYYEMAPEKVAVKGERVGVIEQRP